MQPKSWEDLKVGDSVWTRRGSEFKIIREEITFILDNNAGFSKEGLIWGNFLLIPPEKLTITKQQIAEKFGVDISNLIIE